MLEKRVVVTGMGAITPIGNDVETFWKSIKNGKCGIDEITLFDISYFKSKLAAEVKNYNAEDYFDKKQSKRLDRFSQFAMIASREAFKDSGLNSENIDMEKVGIIIGTGIGGLDTIEKECETSIKKGYNRISPMYIPMCITNMATGNVSIDLGLKGESFCIVSACATGANSIGEAYRMIKYGLQDAVVTGGTEASITPTGIAGFSNIKALTQATDKNRASIPFDKERSGFVMGEGGARAMKNAMKDAKINAEDITYINAHGTSTPMNDSCETSAIKLALGESSKKVMVSSTKGNIGRMLGAAGAIETIICVKSVQDDFVPATINYKVPDEECDLDIVPNVGRNVTVNYAMTNSLGFGGHNASIIVKKYSE